MKLLPIFSLLVVLTIPHISHAYLSPTIVSLMAAASSGLLVAVAAGGVTYAIITVSWIKKNRVLVVTIVCSGCLVVVWNMHQSYQEYQVLREINTFDNSIIATHLDFNSEWGKFFIEYATSRNGLQPSAYYEDGQLSIANLKQLVPSLPYKEVDSRKQIVLGTYCLESDVEVSFQTSCALINAVLADPNDAVAIDRIMMELGISKNDHIVTLCSNGLRSSLVGAVLDRYGYQVDGRVELVSESELYETFGFSSADLGQTSRLIRPLSTQPGKHHMVFTFSENDYEMVWREPEIFLPLAEEGLLSIVKLQTLQTEFAFERAILPVFTNDRLTEPTHNFGSISSSMVDMTNILTDPETVMVCSNPLSCLVVRSHLDWIGSPARTLECLECVTRE